MAHSTSSKAARRSAKSDLPPSLTEALVRVRSDFSDLAAWEALDDVCRQLDRPDEAAALYSEAISPSLSTTDLAQVGRAAAQFCEEWFEETGPVLDTLSAVLDADPTQTWAFERLTVLLTVSAEWDKLLQAYDTALESCEDDARRGLLLSEAGKVARDFASRPEAASDYLKRLLLLRPEDEQLANTLEKRLDEQGRHQDLVDIWEARLSVLSESQALKTRYSIATRLLQALGEPELAYARVEEFLEAGGSGDAACEILAQIAALGSAPVEVRRQALVLLERLHSEAERPSEVIAVLAQALVLAQSDEERIALRRRSSELLSKIGEPMGALTHCAEILKLDPELDEVRDQARELAAAADGFAIYSAALVVAAGVAQAGQKRVALLVEAAQVCREQLDDSAGAIDLFVRCESDPEADEAYRLLACRELVELLAATDRREELLSFLEKDAQLEPEKAKKAEIFGQAASLATEIAQVDRALDLWSKRLELDPNDLEALSSRIELLAQVLDYAGLIDALVARANCDIEEAAQRADLVCAAGVLSDRMEDLSSSISMWQEIEERFGRITETIDSLIDLCHRAERFEEAASLLGEAIAMGGEPSTQVTYYGRLGDTQRLRLKDMEAALESYRQALAIDPTFVGAQDGLRYLIESPNHAHPAVEALAVSLRRAQQFSALVDLVETRLAAAPHAEFRSAVLREAARLKEDIEDVVSALSFSGRAFALLPSEENETELHRLAELAGDFESASEAYGRAIEGQEEEEAVRSLYSARGKLEEEKLSRPIEAANAFREAVRLLPSDPAAVASLVRTGLSAGLFQTAAWGLVESSRAGGELSPEECAYFEERASQNGDWSGVLQGFSKALSEAEELPSRLEHDLLVRLAIWFRDRLEDLDSAEAVFLQAAKSFASEDSLRMLAAIQRRKPGRPLVSTLTALSELVEGELAVLKEAGTVALDPLEDGVLATPLLEKALLLASKRFARVGTSGVESDQEASEVVAWATDGLVGLALAEARPGDAVDLLEASAELPFDRAEKNARRYRAAEAADQAGLESRATGLCEAILQAESHHEGALTLLSTLHERAGRLDDLLELRRRELSLDRPQERRLFLRLDQSRVLGQIGAEISDRTTILRENLVDLPGHETTIEALSSILRAEESYDELAEMLESQAKAIVGQEASRAAGLWEEAGRTVAEHLDDVQRVATDYRLAAAASPSIFVLDQLAEMAEHEKAWESAVSWLQLRLSLTPPSDLNEETRVGRRRVVLQLGKALIASAEREGARDCLSRELGQDPSADELRQLLATVLRELEQWEDLSHLLAGGVEYAKDASAKISYLRRAAVVERRRLGNLEAAIPLLRSAIVLDSTDKGLKLLLADTLRTAERLDEAAELLVGLLAEFGRRRTKERATVHVQLARIAQANGDLDEALAQAEAAANIERTDAVILMLVGEFARKKGHLERAEQAYQTLALIASRRTGSDADDDFEEVGECTILFELYRIAEEKGDESKARELMDSALEVATKQPSEAGRLASALLSIDRVGLLLHALQERLDTGLEGELAARLLVTKANVLEQAGREEEAYVARKLALTQSPQDGLLIDATRRLAESCGASADFWAHVVELAGMNSTQPQIAGELWYRAGLAIESVDPARAAQLYELSQQTGHKPKRGFLALDRVLDERREPERVQAALARYISASGVESSPDVYGDALYRLADFEFTAMRLSDGAEHLLQALEVDAQDERAMSMLEPIVREGGASEAIVSLFLRVCRNAGDEQAQLFAFKEAARQENVEASILGEGIELSRRLQDGVSLRELLSRAVSLAEGRDELEASRSLIVERAELAREDQDYEREVALLRKAIPYFDAEEAFQHELRLAVCLAEHLDASQEGQKILVRLLEDAPDDSQIWRPLLALYRNAGQTSEVEALIAQVEQRVTDETDLEALKMERIRLMVSEQRLAEAEEELRKTLNERPHMAEAASILADLLRRSERWDELKQLVENLYEEARKRGDSVLVVRFGMELAQLVAQEDRLEAIGVLTAGLSFAQSSREYLSYLRSLYSDEDNQSELSDVMELLLSLERGVDARNLAFELYNLRNTLGDGYGAGRALEIAVGLASEQEDLVAFYIEFLRASGEDDKLAEALMLQGERLFKGEPAALKFAEAAAIFDEKIGDAERAAVAISKAFDCDPTNSVYLETGARYLVTLGRVGEALTKLNQAIESGNEMALADLLELRAHIIRRERTSDREAMAQAAADLELALEQLIPEEQEENLQNARVEVLTELRALHQVAEDAKQERVVVLELASVLGRRGETTAGIDTLASWLRLNSWDTDVAVRLGATATEAGDHSTAVFAYERLVKASEGGARTQAVLLLADAADRAGSPLDARQALEEAFSENPSDENLRNQLRAMYEAGGQFDELAQILLAEADKSEDPDTRAALFVDVGDLYVQAENGEAACSVYEQALEITANPYPITSKLAEAYLAMGEVKRADEILTEAVKVHGKRRSPELSILQATLSKVAQAMGNEDGMFAWLEAALMSDRNNAEVASVLAEKAQEQGRYEIAVKALQSLTLSKSDGPIGKAEAYFRQAQIAQAQGDAKKALLMARRASSADGSLPGVGEFLSELGA